MELVWFTGLPSPKVTALVLLMLCGACLSAFYWIQQKTTLQLLVPNVNDSAWYRWGMLILWKFWSLNVMIQQGTFDHLALQHTFLTNDLVIVANQQKDQNIVCFSFFEQFLKFMLIAIKHCKPTASCPPFPTVLLYFLLRLWDVMQETANSETGVSQNGNWK